MISIDCTDTYLGSFNTTTKAALAYDRAVIRNKLSSSWLNFVHSEYSHEDDEEEDDDEEDEEEEEDEEDEEDGEDEEEEEDGEEGEEGEDGEELDEEEEEEENDQSQDLLNGVADEIHVVDAYDEEGVWL